ncbi:MAG: hypothetical protein ACK526_02580 [Planctomyces sp.]
MSRLNTRDFQAASIEAVSLRTVYGGPSGFSVGGPLIPAPPTKAVLPFVCTSHRSPALTSDRWLAPTKAETPHSSATLRLRSAKQNVVNSAAPLAQP